MPEQVERLKKVSLDGDIIRELCKHPGFKFYLERLNEMIDDNKNTWLNGTEEDAKNARFEARGLKRAMDELKKFMLSGDRAKQILVDSSVESDLSIPADSR